MIKKEITAGGAPQAIGPYSQALKLNGFIFCSGQIGIDPKTGEFRSPDIKDQTEQVLENIRQVLKAGGATLDDIVKTTVYMSDLSEFTDMNDTYSRFFKKPFPARATVQVAKLPRGAKVEIEAVAYK